MTSTEKQDLARIDRLRHFQDSYRIPITNIARQAPAEALHSLRVATAAAPEGHRRYLDEAVDCYEAGA